MGSKAETRDIIKNFISYIERQFNHTLKIIRIDNGAEFNMETYFLSKGISIKRLVLKHQNKTRS